MHYPGDYGFIPGTLSEDGDPLDVLTVTEEPSFPGCLIEVRPVGLLNMIDRDEPDQKILAVQRPNPLYDGINTAKQLFLHLRREIEHFFTIYKELEHKKTRIPGLEPARKRRIESLLKAANGMSSSTVRQSKLGCPLSLKAVHQNK